MKAWLAALVTSVAAASTPLDHWSSNEQAVLRSLGPWPVAVQPDPSNRYSGNAVAIAEGKALFKDSRLSSAGNLSCASCHDAQRSFTDARATAHASAPLERNTPSLLNLAGRRWYGWDGGSDSLWAASLRPLLNRQEMNAALAAPALVDTAKKIAAYLETLQSPRTGFDAYRDAVLRGDPQQVTFAQFSEAARRGLRVFLASGCTACHAGPQFSNGEFHDIGIPFFLPRLAGGPARVDPGRFAGLERLAQDPFTRASAYSDAKDREQDSRPVRTVVREPRHFGEWKTPSLRSVGSTAPYMHNGSIATLRGVVMHYSKFNEERIHADGEALLKPLHLSERQIDDLLAFLEAL